MFDWGCWGCACGVCVKRLIQLILYCVEVSGRIQLRLWSKWIGWNLGKSLHSKEVAKLHQGFVLSFLLLCCCFFSHAKDWRIPFSSSGRGTRYLALPRNATRFHIICSILICLIVFFQFEYVLDLLRFWHGHAFHGPSDVDACLQKVHQCEVCAICLQ